MLDLEKLKTLFAQKTFFKVYSSSLMMEIIHSEQAVIHDKLFKATGQCDNCSK